MIISAVIIVCYSTVIIIRVFLISFYSNSMLHEILQHAFMDDHQQIKCNVRMLHLASQRTSIPEAAKLRIR